MILAAGIGIGILIMGLFTWFLLTHLEKNLHDDIKGRIRRY